MKRIYHMETTISGKWWESNITYYDVTNGNTTGSGEFWKDVSNHKTLLSNEPLNEVVKDMVSEMRWRRKEKGIFDMEEFKKGVTEIEYQTNLDPLLPESQMWIGQTYVIQES